MKVKRVAKPNISKKQLAVLHWIAENGPATEYELTKHVKEIGISSFIAHQAPNLLEEKGLLKAEPKGKARTGKTIKMYKLTVEGFLEVLKEKKSWKHVDKIVQSNEQLLPEYFGLWKKFKDMKADDAAFKLLAYAVQKLQYGIPTFPERIENRKPTLRDWLPRLAIYPWDAVVDHVLTEQEATSFLQVILEDSKAQELYASTLEWMIDSHRSAMESFQKALEKYNDLKHWFDVGKRVVEILETDKKPLEKLKALQKDKGLWGAVMRLYPEAKDEKGLLELLQKIATHKENR